MNRRAAFQLVLANPRLRRVVVAFAAFNLADWARWLAVLLYAYEHGGAATAGAVSLAQLVPAAIVAPIGAVLGDRYPRERLLLASYVLQAALMLTTALVVFADGPSIAVYGFAVLGACAITLTRPAHGALLPGLASTPAELTAANAVSATAEGFGVLAGQAAAGLVVQFAGVAAALGVAGSIIALGAALVIGVRVLPAVAAATRSPDPAPAPPAVRGSMLRDLAHELGGGIDAVIRLGGPRTIVLLFGSTDLVWGALDILVVVLVLDVLSSGEGLVGILNALTGLGGLAGSAVALALVGRVRLARPFAVGLLAWGIPLAVIGLVPGAIVAGVLLVVAGAGRTVMDVTGRTLLQRTTPDASLSRVLGVLEGVFMAAFGLGSIVVAGLIDAAGPQAAFVVVGLVLPLAVAVAWRSLVTIDRTAVVPVRAIALLRGIPMFATLEPPIVERLASHLETVAVTAGTAIIRQGDPGDRYYIVGTGEVDVTLDGRHVRTDGPGSGFGEIALLRDIPRTASVTARTDVELFALGRGAFLAAVTGDRAAIMAADEVIAGRSGAASPADPGGAG